MVWWGGLLQAGADEQGTYDLMKIALSFQETEVTLAVISSRHLDLDGA